MQGLLTLLLIGLIVWDLFAHAILYPERKWYHFLPFGALAHLLIKSFKNDI